MTVERLNRLRTTQLTWSRTCRPVRVNDSTVACTSLSRMSVPAEEVHVTDSASNSAGTGVSEIVMLLSAVCEFGRQTKSSVPAAAVFPD